MLERDVPQLGMLEALDSIATTHGLRYYLAYGTLLGAVRHRGFIPWDRDADVCVPIVDYAELRRQLSEGLPLEYELVCRDTDSAYEELFCRIALRGESHLAVHLDVYPLIGAPGDGGLRDRSFSLLCHLVNRAYFVKRVDVRVNYAEKPWKRWAARVVKGLLWPFPVGLFLWLHLLLQRAFPYGSTRSVRNACGPYGRRELMPVEIFGDGTRLPFENLKLNCPVGHGTYLTALYGDYMVERRDNYIPRR